MAANVPCLAEMPDQPVWGFVTTGHGFNEKIEAAMGIAPSTDIDPDLAIALGAAYYEKYITEKGKTPSSPWRMVILASV